jgi:hypothetical protein
VPPISMQLGPRPLDLTADDLARFREGFGGRREWRRRGQL